MSTTPQHGQTNAATSGRAPGAATGQPSGRPQYKPFEQMNKAELIATNDEWFERVTSSRRHVERWALLATAFFLDQQYVDFYQFPNAGTMLTQLPAKKGRVRTVDNLIEPAIRNELARLLRNRPHGVVIPDGLDSEDYEAARAGHNLLEHITREHHLEEEFEETTLWALFGGTAVLDTQWDPTAGPSAEEGPGGALIDTAMDDDDDPLAGLDPSQAPDAQAGIRGGDMNMAPQNLSMQSNGYGPEQQQQMPQGRGEFEFRTLSCFEIGVPHIRKRDIESQPYVMVTKAYELEEIYERWGVEVQADTQNRYGMLDERMTQVLQGGMQPTQMPSSSTTPKVPTAIVKETWVKPSVRAPRGLILITAGDQILEVKEWPDYLKGEYPFCKVDYTKIPGSFWSKGMVQSLIPLQRRHNRASSAMVEQVNLRSSVGVAVPRGTQIKSALGGKSTVYEMPPGSTAPAHNVNVPEVGDIILREIELTKQSVADLSFQHEVCVDAETEALTREGWKSYDELAVGDDVLTYNLESDLSEWKPIEAITTYDWSGKTAYRFTGAVDALVTPNHSWPFENGRGNRSLKKTTEIGSAASRGIPKARFLADFPEESPYSMAFVEIVGWYVTEGNYSEASGKPLIRILQSETANPENCEDIRRSLKEIVDFHENQQSDGCIQFCINDLEMIEELLAFGTGMEKTIPFLFISELTEEQVDHLLRVLVDADGTVFHSSGAERWSFASTNESLVEAVAYCSHLLGFPANVRLHPSNRKRQNPLYTVNIGCSRFASTLKMGIEKTIHDGVVWCPTTENHTFFARRNGVAYFTGNSKGTTPPNVRSGTAINSLKELDDSASTIPLRSIERAVEKQGNIILQMVRELWSDKRVVTVIGDEGDIESRSFIRGDDVGGNFFVQPGSAWPFSKAEKEAEVYRALEYGLIDPAEASRVLEMGGLRKVFNERQLDLRHARRENQMFEELSVVNPESGEVDLEFFSAQVQRLRPADWHEHMVHLQMHNRLRKMPEYEKWPTYRQLAFEAHIMGHQAAIQAQMATQQPQPPQGQAPTNQEMIERQAEQAAQQQQQGQPGQAGEPQGGAREEAPAADSEGNGEGVSERGEGAAGRSQQDQPGGEQGGQR